MSKRVSLRRLQREQASPSPSTRTCCGTPAATSSPTPATTPRAIREWLKHRNIQHTTRYTELTTHRFKDFWQRED